MTRPFFYGHRANLDGFLRGPLGGLRFELTPPNDFFVEYQFHIRGGEVSDEDVPNSPDWNTRPRSRSV